MKATFVPNKVLPQASIRYFWMTVKIPKFDCYFFMQIFREFTHIAYTYHATKCSNGTQMFSRKKPHFCESDFFVIQHCMNAYLISRKILQKSYKRVLHYQIRFVM